MNERGYNANTARSRGKQVRPDDGFHTQPARHHLGWRRKAAIAVTVCVVIIATIFALRAVGDRDAQQPDSSECSDLFDAQVCESIATP